MLIEQESSPLVTATAPTEDAPTPQPWAHPVPAPVPAPRSIKMEAVNGWRGPGAIAIALAHFGIATDFITIRHLEPVALLVDLFFVLSGLLIAAVYSDKLKHASAIPEYVIRRLGRIWPVQAATLAILVCYETAKLLAQGFAGMTFSSPPFSNDSLNLVSAIWTNLLLVQSLGLHDRETWNFPSWSLSVEFATYMIFALFCLLAPVLRHVLAAVTVAACLAILMLVAPYHMRSTYDYGVFRCLAGFFAGTLCYEMVRRWQLPAWPLPTLVEGLAVVMVIVWMAYGPGTPLVFAAPFVFCALIVAFIPQRGLLSRILLTKPLQFLSNLSFTIYMVHAIVLTFFLAFLHGVEHVTGAPLFAAVVNPLAGHPGASPTIRVLHIDGLMLKWMIGSLYLAIVLGLSLIAYRFVEIPGRQAFGTLAKRVAGGTIAATPRAVRSKPVGPA